jgi:uncharacterized membrane protein YiaA
MKQSLSPQEILAVVLCVLYTLWAGRTALDSGGFFWSVALLTALAALALLRGARKTAALLQALIALGWFLLSVLVLGILVACGKKEAPGLWQAIAWGVASFLLAFLHGFLAKHIRSRAKES